MARPPAQARERVCPHCASLATTAERRCPWCGRAYVRRLLPGVAALLAVTAALVLGGVWYMLTAFGDELDSELDRQVRTVRRDFDGDTRKLQRDIERELDRRLPPLSRTPTP